MKRFIYGFIYNILGIILICLSLQLIISPVAIALYTSNLYYVLLYIPIIAFFKTLVD